MSAFCHFSIDGRLIICGEIVLAYWIDTDQLTLFFSRSQIVHTIMPPGRINPSTADSGRKGEHSWALASFPDQSHGHAKEFCVVSWTICCTGKKGFCHEAACAKRSH